MSYRCPICRNFFTDSTSAMCTHMMNTTDSLLEFAASKLAFRNCLNPHGTRLV